jgi:transcriptional regulator with XRE-family HTH domain
MSTSDFNSTTYSSIGHSDALAAASLRRGPMHRLRAVRQEQGYTLRRVAQQMKMDIEEVRQEEDEFSDLPLSRLMDWQRVLEVPLVDLLVETESPLSAPVLQRARMVRLMKTAVAILERTDNTGVRRLAQALAEQLKEIMPELDGVTAWPTTSDRRSAGRLGRIVEQTYDIDVRLD